MLTLPIAFMSNPTAILQFLFDSNYSFPINLKFYCLNNLSFNDNILIAKLLILDAIIHMYF